MTKLDSNLVKKIVSSYYKIQDTKISLQSINDSNDSPEIVDRIVSTLDSIEDIIKRPLVNYSNDTIVGKWAMSNYGIGPIITSGLISYIDVTKAATASAVWRYAGLDPSVKESKSAYSSDLKTLCWKIGNSFAKHSDKENCFYGKLYLQDKTRRLAKNKTLTKNEQLTEEHIDAQARRFAVKIFLSHFHAIAYQEHHNQPPVRPYYINIDGIQEKISIPNNPF